MLRSEEQKEGAISSTSIPAGELVRRCLAGDGEAFNELTEAYASLVTSCIYASFRRYAYSPAREDVEDLNNAFFLSLFEDDYRRLRAFKGQSSFETYIRVIIVRQVVDFLRRQKHHVSIDSDSVNPGEIRERGPAVDELIELSEEEQLLRDGIESLPEQDQLLLKLAVYKELEPRKVCKIMNISMVAYYNRKSRIMKRLKKYCEKSPAGSSIEQRR